jgi:plasmid stability protein
LQLGYCVGVQIKKLLLDPLILEEDCNLDKLRALSSSTSFKQRRSSEETRRCMELVLQSDECPSVLELARSLGYKTDAILYRTDANLCRQLTKECLDKERAAGIKRSWQSPIRTDFEIEALLLKCLAMDCPPSINDIATQLGYSGDGAIVSRFPELTTALIRKSRQFGQAIQRRIRAILKRAVLEQPPPSIEVLSKRPGVPPKFNFYTQAPPDLVNQLRRATAAYKKSRWEEIRTKLAEALVEEPPPAAVSVAKAVGLSVDTLKARFPELAKQISVRSFEHRRRGLKKQEPGLNQLVLES